MDFPVSYVWYISEFLKTYAKNSIDQLSVQTYYFWALFRDSDVVFRVYWALNLALSDILFFQNLAQKFWPDFGLIADFGLIVKMS